MLMPMLLSQKLDYDGDVEEYVATVAKHRRLTHVSFGDFVDLYNGLVDRVKLQNCVRSPLAGSSEAGTSAAAAAAAAAAGRRRDVAGAAPLVRRGVLVSGAAHTAVNGVYSHCGESDGSAHVCVRDVLAAAQEGGGRRPVLVRPGGAARRARDLRQREVAGAHLLLPAEPRGNTPLDVQWERASEGLLPGPYVTPISMAHAAPPSVLAPLQACEVGDYVRSNWAGRGVLYPGEVRTTPADARTPLAPPPSTSADPSPPSPLPGARGHRDDDTVDVLYDDGDFESHVPRERLHGVSIELTDAFHAFSVGDVVKADLKGHGSWYTGRIIVIDTKFRVFTLKYENGHLEKHVPPRASTRSRARTSRADYVRGDRVRANWQGWCAPAARRRHPPPPRPLPPLTFPPSGTWCLGGSHLSTSRGHLQRPVRRRRAPRRTCPRTRCSRRRRRRPRRRASRCRSLARSSRRASRAPEGCPASPGDRRPLADCAG